MRTDISSFKERESTPEMKRTKSKTSNISRPGSHGVSHGVVPNTLSEEMRVSPNTYLERSF